MDIKTIFLIFFIAFAAFIDIEQGNCFKIIEDQVEDIGSNEFPPGCVQENTDSAGKTICPDGQKCPICPLASCDQPYARGVQSAEDCQRLCQLVSSPVNCEYWVYDQRYGQEGWCWLKFDLWIVRDELYTSLGKKWC